jgi:Arc/MetJ-type ribon-helix-helix transcriptional regulator
VKVVDFRRVKVILCTIESKRESVMKTYVETSSILLEGVDEMIHEGYFHDRTEAVNEAIKEMLDRYKLSKLRSKDQKLQKSVAENKE